ncbi:hypothetical protein, variant [Verruconis gallopava]|uniref:PWWP domain-containing protein n=1 Tax=Verruconis gallopava TaxID=253628 RepID=A0A0D1Z5V5_9PEZI|nr:uncharacterized protein PV09_01263 [Verruconis gallopava]XP_016218216.1 hypothetical protein, variant [Verruconis gallopava]KIW08346.1 hypothetical protein PV09_01263 [Verruconis gallopava]KIW08347.1 hypothetical protein, variant [Verruconis gallopava]
MHDLADTIKPEDQGMLVSDGIYWPVLVLHEDMVPEKARLKRENDDLLPVFLFQKDEIRYVQRDEIQKTSVKEFSVLFDLAGHAKDKTLQQAFHLAMRNDGARYWKRYIRDAWLARSFQCEEYDPIVDSGRLYSPHSSHRKRGRDDSINGEFRKRGCNRMKRTKKTSGCVHNSSETETPDSRNIKASSIPPGATVIDLSNEVNDKRHEIWTDLEDAHVLREEQAVSDRNIIAETPRKKSNHRTKPSTDLNQLYSSGHQSEKRLKEKSVKNHCDDTRTRDFRLQGHTNSKSHLSSQTSSAKFEIKSHTAIFSPGHKTSMDGDLSSCQQNLSSTKNDTKKNCSSPRPKDKEISAHKFSVTEDAEIIRFREQSTCCVSWLDIATELQQRFPSTKWLATSIRLRYLNCLKEGAQGDKYTSAEACTKARKRALAYLKRQTHHLTPVRTELKLDAQDDKTTEINTCEDGRDEKNENVEKGKLDGNNCSIDKGARDEDENKSKFDVDKAPKFSLNNNDRGSTTLENVSNNVENDTEEEMITVIIGKEKKKFRVPITRILGNVLFIEDAQIVDGLGTVVTGARWARITPDAFWPVYEYLKYGDYRPRMVGDQIEEVEEGGHGGEIVRCGQAFDIARELQIDELMSLACRKFRILNKGPAAVMMAARLVFKREPDETIHDALMRELILDEIDSNYQRYFKQQSREIFILAREAIDFKQGLWKRLGLRFTNEAGEK